MPAAGAGSTSEVTRLLAMFQAESAFWRQIDIADDLAAVAAPRDLVELEPWLAHEDRRTRANAAYLFARVGDPRGLEVLEAILGDFSAGRRVEWQGGSLVTGKDDPHGMERHLRSPSALRAQIRTDRYYAVHVLGRLRDPRAVPMLLPLLEDDAIDYNVAWALGEIGDRRAITALIVALRDPDALVRQSAIHALVKLRATESLPDLVAMFGDAALPSAGDRVPVGVTARKAAEALRAAP
jgi:HEAT repeat protein